MIFDKNRIYLILIILFLLSIVYSFCNTECTIALCIIRMVHALFVLYIVLGPFVTDDITPKSKDFLKCYIIISSFTIFHWIIANDTCALTLLEQYLTGRTSEKTFIGKIVKPVYNITNKQITVITVLLLLIAIVKYYNQL